jgi:hypothetical protein
LTALLRNRPSKTKPAFSNTRRRGIIGISLGVQAMEPKILETILRKCGNNLAHDAASPEFFREPITQLRCVTALIFARAKANPANGLTVDLDAKIFPRLIRNRAPQKIVCVSYRVRMRKRVTQSEPDAATIRVRR